MEKQKQRPLSKSQLAKAKKRLRNYYRQVTRLVSRSDRIQLKANQLHRRLYPELWSPQGPLHPRASI